MSDATPEKPPNLGKRTTVKTGAVGEIEQNEGDIFFAAVETTRMPMIVTDPRQHDNPIVFSNRAFLQMTGYAHDEIIGRNCRFLQGPETDRRTVDEVREAIAARRDIATEILNYRKNGSTFWNALFISPVYNRAGELVYFFASQLDVSRRRDAEDALRQSQKMEALGQLTGGIAHDFNNLLQVVVGYLDVMQATLDRAELDRDRLRTSVHHVREAAKRATTLTAQLLAFARKQRLDGRTVNLNSLVQNMHDLVARTLGEHIAIDLRLAPELANCRIDPTQAEVALLNVLINARDAVAQRANPQVVIETRDLDISEADAHGFGRLQPGRYVSIAVSDNGHGIPADMISRVMEPFFTTKDEGKGTGLGLSMVYGFAKQSGGIATIYSEEGVGTTVRLYFPAKDETDSRKKKTALRVMDRPGTETIVVVDDRGDVADLAKLFLEDFGYSIHLAHDGRSALELLDTLPQVDLLFTDLIMPGGINGIVLAREARRRRPRIKVLLTTGYADMSLERTDESGTEFDLINKPYGRVELARKVRQILDGPTGVG